MICAMCRGTKRIVVLVDRKPGAPGRVDNRPCPRCAPAPAAPSTPAEVALKEIRGICRSREGVGDDEVDRLLLLANRALRSLKKGGRRG